MSHRVYLICSPDKQKHSSVVCAACVFNKTALANFTGSLAENFAAFVLVSIGGIKSLWELMLTNAKEITEPVKTSVDFIMWFLKSHTIHFKGTKCVTKQQQHLIIRWIHLHSPACCRFTVLCFLSCY